MDFLSHVRNLLSSEVIKTLNNQQVAKIYQYPNSYQIFTKYLPAKTLATSNNFESYYKHTLVWYFWASLR